MGANQLPEDLTRARSRFQAWRRGRRKPGGRIPKPLWALAVRLVKTHGVSRTATVLGLDYYGLKKQVEVAGEKPKSSKPAFVELPSPLGIGKQGRFELDNGAGVCLRVQLAGYDTADLEALVRGFWSAR